MRLRHYRIFALVCLAESRCTQAPAPPRTIERGLGGPGLLVHVLVAKYADHCPLYRQAEIYAREGVDLDRSAMAGWVGASSELLAPLVSELRSTHQATYAWLYRHDRRWLRKTSEELHCARTTKRRVDWAERDQELCHRVEKLANDLRHRQDRARISKTILLRTAGEAMVRVNLGRLPRLNTGLQSLVESPETFQMFRIDRAVGRFAAQGLPLSLWPIQRSACLKQWSRTLRLHANRKITEYEVNFTIGLP